MSDRTAGKDPGGMVFETPSTLIGLSHVPSTAGRAPPPRGAAPRSAAAFWPVLGRCQVVSFLPRLRKSLVVTHQPPAGSGGLESEKATVVDCPSILDRARPGGVCRPCQIFVNAGILLGYVGCVTAPRLVRHAAGAPGS